MILVGAFVSVIAPALAESQNGFVINQTVELTATLESQERSYSIFVKTPPGYDAPKNKERYYPVIYMTDAPHTFQVASGATHLGMGQNGEQEPAILVAIGYAHGEDGMHSRVFDLTPWHDDSWTRYKTGNAEVYFEFLSQLVIPMVEKNYRASTSNRTLAGHSLGGSFGAWVLLKHPEVFENYILTSPSLWFLEKQIFETEALYAEANDDVQANVYFAIGDYETKNKESHYEMVDDLAEFVRLLESREYQNLKIRHEVLSETGHDTAFAQGFVRGVNWLYRTRVD